MKYCKNNGLVKLKETRLKSLVFSVVGARANPQLDRVNGGKGGNLLRIVPPQKEGDFLKFCFY